MPETSGYIDIKDGVEMTNNDAFLMTKANFKGANKELNMNVSFLDSTIMPR